jgi:demethylmenaquinone methyltransferase/2-methoxy-6-polyprenyl-1,4-benzoquinol methylase
VSSFQPGDPEAVEQLFDQIAPRYDQLNDLLSLGLHRLWKRQAVAWLRPRAGLRLLDLCCGTGDLALVLAARVRPGGVVLGLDAAAAPLKVAARRAARQPWLPVRWQQADAQATGLPAGSFDGAAMAYGLRNLADPAAGLVELRRLLRPGGRAAVLDFNRLAASRLDPAGAEGGGSGQAGHPMDHPAVDPVENPIPVGAGAVAAFQRFYLRSLVVPVASAAGLREHYAYLEESLARFPTGAQQEQLALAAGFSHAHHRPLAAGLMGLLELVA